MHIVPAPDIANWLASWDNAFEWDPANLLKLEKHGFSKENVEIACSYDFYFAGEVIEQNNQNIWGERRFILYSILEDGRYITIVFTIKGNLLRPISCRRSRDGEKKKYHTRF